MPCIVIFQVNELKGDEKSLCFISFAKFMDQFLQSDIPNLKRNKIQKLFVGIHVIFIMYAPYKLC